MRDITDDRDAKTFERFSAVENSSRVQQRLRRMLMRPVARVDDRRLQMPLQKMRRTRCRVPHDDRVRAHGGQGIQSIDQRFSLGYAGRLGRNRDRIGS